MSKKKSLSEVQSAQDSRLTWAKSIKTLNRSQTGVK